MIKKILLFVRSYFFIVTLALVLGIVFPSPIQTYLAPYVTYFLGAIFFFSSLKIDIKKIKDQLHKPTMILLVVLLMLVVFPIVVFYITKAIYPDLAIAFLILASMPAGMTAPFLVEMSGGRQPLALILTVLTSLFAPFTIPLLIGLLAGEIVHVEYLSILMSLATVIFIPFFLAQLVRICTKNISLRLSSLFSTISTMLLGLLIAGIVSNQADVIIKGFKSGTILFYLFALFILFASFHLFGYYAIWWRDKKDRITITITLSYMNFTLAVYLVDQFFNKPSITVPVVLSVIPWTLMFIPFKKIINLPKITQSDI